MHMSEFTELQIDPDIEKFFCFERNNQDWQYSTQKHEQTMPDIQAKGVHDIQKILKTYNVAYLADEVGMGKTIQALAYCTLLWNENPDAKILVIAPRTEVARNWKSEYSTFQREHCKSHLSDKSIFPTLHFSDNLYRLLESVSIKANQFFIAKTTSFSALTTKDEKSTRASNIRRLLSDDVETNNAEQIGRAINKAIKTLVNKDEAPFDLLIIDEAHFFRRYGSKTQKDLAAKTIFKGIAKKTLLLTATPNHTSSSDIKNILKYFIPESEHESLELESIIKNQIVRRNRKLNNKEKFEYREEEASIAELGNPIESELFFALYQKKLVEQSAENVTDLSKGRRLLNYLEGTEFIPTEKIDESEDESKQTKGSDFYNGNDAEILQELVEKYKKIFSHINNGIPSHPKYDELLKYISPRIKKRNLKYLIFVRRIPSVKEIAKRSIKEFDHFLIDRFNNLFPTYNLDYEKVKNREQFNQLFSDKENNNDIDNEREGEADAVDDVKIPNSRFLDLFKVKKNKKIMATAASNFRLSLLNRYNSPFIIFFQPILNVDQPEKGYVITKLKKRTSQSGNSSDKDDFQTTVLEMRRQEVSYNGGDNIIEEEVASKKVNEYKTFLNIIWQHLSDEVKKKYKEFTESEKESFSVYLSKGLCLGSQYIIDFFALYWKHKGQNKQSTKLYNAFVDELILSLKSKENTPLIQLVEEAILTFEVVYKKAFGIAENELKNQKWDEFNNTQPAYPYSAGTKNERIRKCFNTPFYPNHLISTSVLQEGVNLQYFCDEVIHYGMAWTPGDNEQRIGRIDRMFGLIDRNLGKNNGGSTLKIQYPFLKGTVDEQHVTSFIKRKYFEEELIEKLQNSENVKSHELFELDNSDWEAYLRKPCLK